jgi:chlorobactene glucosyltransferase
MVAATLYWEWRRTPTIASINPATSGPLVSVIVPARDEAKRIAPLLASLGAQRYPSLEVLIVDDGSTDGTADLVRSAGPRITLVSAPPRPGGWVGKSWAVHTGAARARGELLLFLDADVRLDPDCLGKVVAAQAAVRSDLFTLLPRVEARRFWERAVQPLVLQLAIGWQKPRLINDPRSLRAGGNGPFLLFTREAYARLGGHEAFRRELIEDLAMARAVKRAGGRIAYWFGVEWLSIRMYQSLGEIIAGWRKNFFVALGSTRLSAVAAPIIAPLLLVFYGAPIAALLPALWFAALGEPRPFLCALVASLAVLPVQWVLRRGYGLRAPTALHQPFGALAVGVILLDSALRAGLGLGITWKGRRYTAGG